MPITIRPSEMSCSVAWAEAVTAGSRVTGLVTHMPICIRVVLAASSVISGYGSCHRIGESYVQPLSKPSDSALTISSTSRW